MTNGNGDGLMAQQRAMDLARDMWAGMDATFQGRKRRARAVVNSVVRDSAGRTSGALASIDGSNDQPMLIDHGQPINPGDVFSVTNDGTVSVPQWRALRKIASTSAIPNAGELPTMPTPTGLTLSTGGSSVGAPGLPVWAWVFADWDIIDSALYGGQFDYELQYASNENIHAPESKVVMFDQPTTTLSHTVSISDTLVPRVASGSYPHQIDDFPYRGQARMSGEEFTYTKHTAGPGLVGTGMAGTNQMTDPSASWSTDYWTDYILIDANGDKFLVTGNDTTIVYFSGSAASGTYTLQPGFSGCTRGANGTTPAVYAAGQSVICESVGTKITGLEPGSTLNVRLRAQRYDGALSGWTAWQSVTVYSDSLAPPAPTGFAVESIGTGILLTWDAPTLLTCADLAGFYIWESDDATGTGERYRGLVGNSRTQTVVHTTNYNQTYYYCIQAVDSSGNISAKTERLAGQRLPIGGINLLPNPDMEIPSDDGTMPLYWFVATVGTGADFRWGDYGMLGGKGLRFALPTKTEAGGTSWVNASGPHPLSAWLIYAEVGQPYTATIYVKTDSEQVVYDISDVDSTHKHFVYIEVSPHNGTHSGTAREFVIEPAVISETGDGWERVQFNFEASSDDWGFDSGFNYVFLTFGALNESETDQLIVDFDRVQLEVAGDATAWGSGASAPPGQGLRIDSTSIVGTYYHLDGDGRFQSDLVPQSDYLYNLGRTDKRWDTLYCQTVIADEIQGMSGDVHDAVTLGTNADTVLALTDQELDLDTQVANLVWAGPASGGAAAPTFRALVAGDLPGEPHDAATLTTAAGTLLGLSGQEIDLDTQAAGTVFAGPASGGATTPTFRALQVSDLPGSAPHDAVTLDANAGTLLGLTNQEIGLDDQAQNAVFAGPASGGSGTPAFRSIVAADLTGLLHSPVTLATDADTLLSLSDQEIGLDTQLANRIFAGPASGGAVDPTFRSLVVADLPAHASTHLPSGSDPLTTAAAPTLTVATVGATGTANSLARSDHLHSVTTSSNPGAAASILASSSSGYLQLTRLGIGVSPSYALHVSSTTTPQARLYHSTGYYTDVYTDSGGSGHIDPTGDVIVDPVGKDFRPERTYDLNLGTQQYKWLSLWAAELNVDTLVARDVIATVGGRVVVAPSTYLTRDLSATDTTIYVSHNQIQDGDTVWMEARGRVEFMLVSSAATEAAEELTNGHFNSSLTGWTESAGDGSIARTTGWSHSGAGSVMLTSGSSYNTHVYQNEGVSAGEVYILRFWHTDSHGSNGARYKVRNQTAGTDLIAMKELPELSTAEFSYCEVRFTVPSGCTSVGIYLYGPDEDGAKAYIDDVSLKKREYSYTVTRDRDGTGENWWFVGDGVVNTGAAGDGFIDIYSDWSIGGRPLTYIFNYDASSGDYSDNLHLATNWTMYPSSPALNDCVYFGLDGTTWDNLYTYLGTAGNYDATITWEYRGASSWTAFTPDINNSWETAGPRRKTWDSGTDFTSWTAYSVNGFTAYWVRARISARTSWTTSPVVNSRRVAYDKGGYGPTIVGNVRQTSTFNDWETRWAIGNMDGLYGVAGHEYGIGLGDYDAGNYLKYDGTDGLLLSAGGGVVGIDDDGINLYSTTEVYSDDSQAIRWYKGTDLIGTIETGYSTDFASVLIYSDSLASDSYSTVAMFARSSTGGNFTGFEATGYSSLGDPHANITVSGSGVLIFYPTYMVTGSGYDYRIAGGLSLGDQDQNPGEGDLDYTGDLSTYRDSAWETGHIYVPLTTPETHTSFDGDSFSTVSSSTSITATSEFSGVPAGATAVVVSLVVQDSGTWGGGEYTFWLGPTSTYYYQLATVCYGGDYKNRNQGIVNLDGDGKMYYRCTASSTATMQVWLRIWGYFV